MAEGREDERGVGSIAAQDGVIHTAVYCNKILKHPTSPTCRACSRREETLGHILSGCESHTWGLYKERNDRVLFQLVKAITNNGNTNSSEAEETGGILGGGGFDGAAGRG